MEKSITEVHNNFTPYTDLQLIINNHQTVDVYVVGKHDVAQIKENVPQFAGDQHYCDVFFNNGNIERIFNLNKIIRKNDRTTI